MTEERWMPVVGYAGTYEVSDHGRVRSLPRRSRNGRLWAGVPIALATHDNGHLQVHLSNENIKRTQWVHRMVLDAFVGPAPEGCEALHRNGDPADNRLTNLTWGTRSRNTLDQVNHGVHFQAAKTHCPHGHPYSNINTYLSPAGNHRKCRECMRAQSIRTNERRRAAKRAAA